MRGVRHEVGVERLKADVPANYPYYLAGLRAGTALFSLANERDDYFTTYFETPEEVDEMIRALEAAKREAFGVTG